MRAAFTMITMVVSTTQYAVPNARVADFGPSASISEIKLDVPLLLEASLGKRSPLVNMVYTDGKEAVVTWHRGGARGLIVLQLKRDRWWWLAASATVNSRWSYWTPLSSPGEEVTECGAKKRHGPTADEILSRGFISSSFAQGLAQHLKMTQGSPDGPAASCDYPPYEIAGGGYDASLASSSSLEGLDALGGAPPEDQMPPLYYEFTFTTHSAVPVKVEAGTILRIWFPFVVNEQNRYTLRISGTDEDIHPVGGLADNTLSFALPALSLLAGGKVHGAIAGRF